MNTINPIALAGHNSAAVDLTDLGAKALKLAAQSEAGRRKAGADMTYVASQSLDRPFHAFYQKADKTVIVNEEVTIRDILNRENVKAMSGDVAAATTAIYDAAILTLTGLDMAGPSEKQKAARWNPTPMRDCFKSALGVVAGLVEAGIVEAVTLSKGGNLKVPFEAMHEAPKPDASEAALEAWEARKGTMTTIDGTRGNSFAELKRKMTPKPANGDDRAGAGQGKVEPTTWLEAVKAKLKNAQYKEEKGMDWAAYVADWNGADLLEAAMLLSSVRDDKAE